MGDRVYSVLFLCTGNSVRSILAEAMMNELGRCGALRSKSWDEFAAPGAPVLDFVFTVCGRTAGEVCPLWPGRPMRAHWEVEDPSAVGGSDEEKRRAFRSAARLLRHRIQLFLGLPLERMDSLSLGARRAEIGDAGVPEGVP